MPLRYVDVRAKVATHWYQCSCFRCNGPQASSFSCYRRSDLVVLHLAGARPHPPADDKAAFARRYVTMLALGPFLVTTRSRSPPAVCRSRCGAIRSGRSRRSPRCSGSGRCPARAGPALRGRLPVCVRRDAVAYAAVEGSSPHLRDRPKATQFPGRRWPRGHAAWREKFARRSPLSAAAISPPTISRSIRPTGRACIVHADPSKQPVGRPQRAAPRGAVHPCGRTGSSMPPPSRSCAATIPASPCRRRSRSPAPDLRRRKPASGARALRPIVPPRP